MTLTPTFHLPLPTPLQRPPCHPLQIQSALERVRAGADVMPRSQLEGQLVAELGPDWAHRLQGFDWTPRAAASIGQVHAAHLPDGTQVAMKIQYPGGGGGGGCASMGRGALPAVWRGVWDVKACGQCG
jgi:hypothetical protein